MIMDFSNTCLFLLGVVVSFLQIVPNSGGHRLVKRNALQMCNLMHHYTGRSCLSYNPYGCFCGLGQAGSRPVDAADSCCKDHDDCYGEVTTQNSCSFWSVFVGYEYTCTQHWCRCTDDYRTSRCSRAVCECDNRLALCLSRSNYNPELKFYDRRLCV